MLLRRRVLEWAVFVALWLLLVFKTDMQNLAAAALVSLLAVIGISEGSRYLQASYAVPGGWASAIAQLPARIILDTGRVFLALVRHTAKRDQVVGELVRVPFDYGSHGPDDEARLAITLYCISLTPNTVAITTLPDGVLVHQLKPVPEPAGGRDPRWPV